MKAKIPPTMHANHELSITTPTFCQWLKHIDTRTRKHLLYSATSHAIFPYISLRQTCSNPATFSYIFAYSATIPTYRCITFTCSKACYHYCLAERFNCPVNCAVLSVRRCHTPCPWNFRPGLQQGSAYGVIRQNIYF